MNRLNDAYNKDHKAADHEDSPAKRRTAFIRKKWGRITLTAFSVLIVILFAAGLLLPLRPSESQLERRSLAEFPSFSLEALWDGSYFENLVLWFSDTFPFREQLLTAEAGIESMYGLQDEAIYGNTGQTADDIPASGGMAPVISPSGSGNLSGESAPEGDSSNSGTQSESGAGSTSDSSVSSGSVTASSSGSGSSEPDTSPEAAEELPDGSIHDTPETAGTVYLADNRAFEIYYFNHGGADAYASMINTVRSRVGSGTEVYTLLAPTSFGVCLDESVQSSLGGSSQRDAFNYIFSMLDPSVHQVSVYDELVRHNAEYLYYGTDHHWTALGAYYSYREFAEARGLTPHELSYFTEQAYPGFLGTFYSYSNQAEALKNNPDTVYAYVPSGTNDAVITNADGETFHWNVVTDVSEYGAGLKYNSFIGGDNPYTEINNPAITDGSSCVVVKESYGNAFVPFLVDHYQTVYVIDYRYYTGNLTQFIQERGVDDLLFLNNADALSERNSATMLALFP